MAFAALVLSSARAHAQEEDTPDHGSRAAEKASGARRAGKRKAKAPLTPTYHLGAFGGSFVQGAAPGLLLNAGVGANVVFGRERLRLGIDYQYDPFTTKTFNFPEEDQAASESRLAQGLHEVDARAEWQSRWARWLKSELSLSGDVWLPEVAADRRWSLRSAGQMHFGGLRGIYAEPSVAAIFKEYPEYHIADRRIDQRGLSAGLETGYQWAAFSSAALGTEVELTDYLDARYDEMAPDGSVERATESKDYVSTNPYLDFALAPVQSLHLNLRYTHEWNDSSHYSRRIPARDELGNPVDKFIPDYYDYARDRVDLKARLSPNDAVSMSALAEGWLREFDTYEARDRDNAWTGDLRHDESLELGAEISVHLLDVDALGLPNGLYAAGFGSHLIRRSNMRREVSFATNFDVTRVFIGLEVRQR